MAGRVQSVERLPELERSRLSELRDFSHADKIVCGAIISGTARAVSLLWIDPVCS